MTVTSRGEWLRPHRALRVALRVENGSRDRLGRRSTILPRPRRSRTSCATTLCMGLSPAESSGGRGSLVVDGTQIPVFHIETPADLPWDERWRGGRHRMHGPVPSP